MRSAWKLVRSLHASSALSARSSEALSTVAPVGRVERFVVFHRHHTARQQATEKRWRKIGRERQRVSKLIWPNTGFATAHRLREGRKAIRRGSFLIGCG